MDNFQTQTNKMLVLDLDETLIHSTPLRSSYCCLNIRIGRRIVYFQKRPGLDEFLKEIKKYYDIYFFTASTTEYGNKIIDLISSETPINKRFFRDSCNFINGYIVKDLNLITNNLNNILIVDDCSSVALFQPQNLIKIKPFTGFEEDNYLIEFLLPYLINLSSKPTFI